MDETALLLQKAIKRTAQSGENIGTLWKSLLKGAGDKHGK